MDGPLVEGYRPGACNIGEAELRRRRMWAIATSIVTIGLAAALVAANAPAALRLALAIPLAAALVTGEQVRRRFCVAFGLAGLRNFGPLGGETRVETETLAADRRTALLVIGRACLVAAVVALGFALLGR